MKKILGLFLLGCFWISSTGAALIDNDTKNRVTDLEKQVNALQAQSQSFHDEQMKALRELTSRPAEVAAPVDATQQAAATPPPQPAPPAPTIINPPAVTVTIPGEVTARFEHIEKMAKLGIYLVGGSFLAMLFSFFIMVRWMEKRFRKLVFRNEMDNLREVLSARKPAVKVYSEGQNIVVANTGKFSVDQVRLAVGTAPNMFKIKMRPIPQIEVGERTTLPLPSGISGDTLYASVQYKDAQTHKVYRDQFVLKIQEMMMTHRFDEDVTEIGPIPVPETSYQASYQHAM